MDVVIKRDGKKERFNASKIRRGIQKATREAKMSVSSAKGLISDVAESVISRYKNKKVRTTEIRRTILGKLDRKAKSVSAAWRRFDRRRR